MLTVPAEHLPCLSKKNIYSLLRETKWIHSLGTESRLYSKCSDVKFQEGNETTVRIRTVREGSHEEVRCKERKGTSREIPDRGSGTPAPNKNGRLYRGHLRRNQSGLTVLHQPKKKDASYSLGCLKDTTGKWWTAVEIAAK